jgi:hypothetical protein
VEGPSPAIDWSHEPTDRSLTDHGDTYPEFGIVSKVRHSRLCERYAKARKFGKDHCIEKGCRHDRRTQRAPSIAKASPACFPGLSVSRARNDAGIRTRASRPLPRGSQAVPVQAPGRITSGRSPVADPMRFRTCSGRQSATHVAGWRCAAAGWPGGSSRDRPNSFSRVPGR